MKQETVLVDVNSISKARNKKDLIKFEIRVYNILKIYDCPKRCVETI